MFYLPTRSACHAGLGQFQVMPILLPPRTGGTKVSPLVWVGVAATAVILIGAIVRARRKRA